MAGELVCPDCGCDIPETLLARMTRPDLDASRNACHGTDRKPVEAKPAEADGGGERYLDLGQAAQRIAELEAERDSAIRAHNEIEVKKQHALAAHRNLARVLADKLTAAESRAEAAEATIESCRRALSSAGYCGEGNLEQMVTRALKEAKGVDAGLLSAELRAASAQFPDDYEGTVSERVVRLRREKEAAEEVLTELLEACSPSASKARINAARNAALALLEAKAGGR